MLLLLSPTSCRSISCRLSAATAPSITGTDNPVPTLAGAPTAEATTGITRASLMSRSPSVAAASSPLSGTTCVGMKIYDLCVLAY